MTPQERIDAALKLLSEGVSEGEHHVLWLVDQLLRTLTDCPTVRHTATDIHGTQYNYYALGESQAYTDFVRNYQDGEDGPQTYTWDEGIAP